MAKFTPVLQDQDLIAAKLSEVDAAVSVAKYGKILLIEIMLLAALTESEISSDVIASTITQETAWLASNEFGISESNIQPTILSEAKKRLM